LGSFRIFGVGRVVVGANWVRFAETGGGWTRGIWELGSFCIFRMLTVWLWGQIGFVSTKSGVVGRWGRGKFGFPMCIGTDFRPARWARIGFVSHNWGESRSQERNALRQAQDGETPRAFYLMVVLWALVIYSPCFWCCFIPNYATHYTMLFDICQMLNKINHGYLPRKGLEQHSRNQNDLSADVADSRRLFAAKRYKRLKRNNECPMSN